MDKEIHKYIAVIIIATHVSNIQLQQNVHMYSQCCLSFIDIKNIHKPKGNIHFFF